MSAETVEPVESIQPSKTIKIKPISKKRKKDLDIYSSAIITKDIYISIVNVGTNIKETIRVIIVKDIEGKCIPEGYIKPDSVKIMSYSNGIVKGSNIQFQVLFECSVCCPVEGTHINCIVKNITKAGIRAELNETISPVVIFIARDHNYMSKKFSAIQENQPIKIRVIGQRYELNDKYISIIGELIDDNPSKSNTPLKKLEMDDALISSPSTSKIAIGDIPISPTL